MHALAPDLWTVVAPQRFLGLELGARMTVVRLPGGDLLLHSPVSPSEELFEAVEALGPVSCLVAPNLFHHLHVAAWQRRFPDAALFVAPGLERKRPDLRGATVLGDAPAPAWSAVLDQVFLEGFTLSNELVFFHRPSATLLATDLAFHIGPEAPALTRLAFGLIGSTGRLAPTLLERLMVRPRPVFRRALDRVLAWPAARVVVAHGPVVEEGGREALAAGFGWLPAAEGA